MMKNRSLVEFNELKDSVIALKSAVKNVGKVKKTKSRLNDRRLWQYS